MRRNSPVFCAAKAGQSHAHYSTTGLKRSDLIIDSRVHQLDMIPHDITMFRTFQHLAIHHLLKDRAVHRNFLFVSGDLSKLTININQSPSEPKTSVPILAQHHCASYDHPGCLSRSCARDIRRSPRSS